LQKESEIILNRVINYVNEISFPYNIMYQNSLGDILPLVNHKKRLTYSNRTVNYLNKEVNPIVK